MICRSCNAETLIDFCDLGGAPPSNKLITASQLRYHERWYPLKLNVCAKCFLVQTIDVIKPDEIFTSDYVYFSSYSSTWTKHAEIFVQQAIQTYGLNHNSFVVEVASNDGYLLQFVKKHGIPCLGIEPAKETSAIAVSKGIDVINEFFDLKLGRVIAEEYGKADLIIANNVLAHVPDPANILRGFYSLLKPNGVVSVEFHSLKELIARQAIDTIYHEHFSYYSLHSFKIVAERALLKIVDVQELDSHGGSLRVYLTKDSSAQEVSSRVGDMLTSEHKGGINNINTYENFSDNAMKIKHSCMNFLLEVKAKGLKIAGYGAAAKASTLLNFAEITTDLLPFIADKNPNKVGKFIPGCRVPIVSVEELIKFEPDLIVIFPWNIKTEIIEELTPKLSKKVRFFQLAPEVILLK